jgi:hypothetical protein
MDDRSWYGLGTMVLLYPPVRVWFHSGGSPGSRSQYVRISNGFSYTLLFNGDGTGSDAFLAALSDALKAEVQKSRSWPSQDLFPQYLAPRAIAVVDALTFAAGPAAPASVLSVFGSELNPVVARIEDSAGVEHGVEVLYASLTQVNIRLPGEVAAGPATLVLHRAPHAGARIALEIAR